MAESKMIFIFLLIQTFVGVWTQSPECLCVTDKENMHDVISNAITDFTFVTAYLNSSHIVPNILQMYSSSEIIVENNLEEHRVSCCKFNLNNFNAKILTGLPNFNALYLNKNNISSIPGEMFKGLSQIQILGLSYNNLTSIDNESYANLINLEILYLKNNSIYRIDEGAFRSNNKLTSLALENNLLTSFDSRVLEGTELKYLDLGGNHFENISQVVLNISTLETLYLDNCKITTLPLGFFNNVPNLKRLGLELNNLTTIPAGLFTPLPELRILSIERNHLPSMNVDTFQQFYQIMQASEDKDTVDMTDFWEGRQVPEEAMYFDENPWNCNTSDMEQLRQWCVEREVDFNYIFQCPVNTK